VKVITDEAAPKKRSWPIAALIASVVGILAVYNFWHHLAQETQYNFPKSGKVVVDGSPFKGEWYLGPHTNDLALLANFLRDNDGETVLLNLDLGHAVIVLADKDPLSQLFPDQHVSFYLLTVPGNATDRPTCPEPSDPCPNQVLPWPGNRLTVRIDGRIAIGGDIFAVAQNNEYMSHVTGDGAYLRLHGYFADEGPVDYTGRRLLITPFVLRPVQGPK
jgi:hypothetical protein